MTAVFGFCLRFLVSFLVAKLLLRALEVEHMSYLVGLSLLLTANLYWFDFPKYSDRRFFWQTDKPSQKDKDGVGRKPSASPPAPGNGA